jgi:GTP cyclohydrolase I
MTNHTHITWADVDDAAERLAQRWAGAPIDAVFGVPRGGLVPALLASRLLHVPLNDAPPTAATRARVLVVDDLADSGATAARFAPGPFDALFRKPATPTEIAPAAVQRTGWLVFPWEQHDETAGPTDAVRRILQHIGEDPNRDGLLDTPKRVVKAFTEMTVGYAQDPGDILSTTFDVDCDEMVVVTGIRFTSLCEHHLLPFIGTATVAYIPGQVVGLSKLARLVECYARRLQVQERMTNQIADSIEEHLNPQGVGVVVRAHHACMGCRGVRQQNAEMVTSALRGFMRDKADARAEFLALTRAATG